MVSCSYFLWTETLSDLGRKEAFIKTEEVNKTHKGSPLSSVGSNSRWGQEMSQ